MRTGGLSSQDWREQLAALRASLRASQAEWKIVIGHHPPRTNGHHNNTVELMQHLEPVLQVRAYFLRSLPIASRLRRGLHAPQDSALHRRMQPAAGAAGCILKRAPGSAGAQHPPLHTLCGAGAGQL